MFHLLLIKSERLHGERAAGSTSPHRNVNYIDDSEVKCILTSISLPSELHSLPDFKAGKILHISVNVYIFLARIIANGVKCITAGYF